VNISFASVGTGLTGTDLTNYFTAVYSLQENLQRAYLLNFFPGARVAYSLRKLSNTYTGSAIQVRRSTDSALLDIGFSGKNLDTQSLMNFVGSGTGYVTTWYDQSGYNNHVTQSLSGTGITIAQNGVLNTLNSKPVVTFNTAQLRGATYPLTEFSLYGVFQVSSAPSYAGYYYNRSTTGYSFKTQDNYNNTPWESELVIYSASIDSWGSSQFTAGNSYAYPLTPQLLENWNWTTSSVSFSQQGVSFATGPGTSGNAGSSGYSAVGGTAYGGAASGIMNIQEVIVFSIKQQNSGSITSLINNYYNIY
jgi:hypothetical protein